MPSSFHTGGLYVDEQNVYLIPASGAHHDDPDFRTLYEDPPHQDIPRHYHRYRSGACDTRIALEKVVESSGYSPKYLQHRSISVALKPGNSISHENTVRCTEEPYQTALAPFGHNMDSSSIASDRTLEVVEQTFSSTASSKSAIDSSTFHYVPYDGPALMISISGPTSTGETTMAHILAMCFEAERPVYLLHQDDFFISKNLIVPNMDSELDADCCEAVDFASFKLFMDYVRREGMLPPHFKTLQDDATEQFRARTLLTQKEIECFRSKLKVAGNIQPGRPVCIIEGFLLFQDDQIRNMLDIKIFLRITMTKAQQRRFARSDYMGLNLSPKFWWRTKEYFDRVVWRNYTQEHKFLFVDEDVEGSPNSLACDAGEIHMVPWIDAGVMETASWMVDIVANEIPESVALESLQQRGAKSAKLARNSLMKRGQALLGLPRKSNR